MDQNKQAIPYVNIGIVGKGIGTVSDFEGNFKLSLPDSLNNQILRFSCIGFKPVTSTVIAFKSRFNTGNASIIMEENIFSLNQVVVKPKVFKTKILGNENNSKAAVAGFVTNDLGSELGVIMHIKKAPTFIEKININLAYNSIGKIKFRMNIYNMKHGEPDSIILTQPIIVVTEQKTGILTVDMKPYNVSVTSDFLVSLEWIENYGNENLRFCTGLLNNNCLYRKTSQDAWHNARPAGIGINAEVVYEK